MKSYLMYDLTHYLLAIISHHGNVKVVLSKNVGRNINKLITRLYDIRLTSCNWKKFGRIQAEIIPNCNILKPFLIM